MMQPKVAAVLRFQGQGEALIYNFKRKAHHMGTVSNSSSYVIKSIYSWEANGFLVSSLSLLKIDDIPVGGKALN